jgi:hypothetical protein
MVNVLGVRCAADRALTSLSSENLIELRQSQLVPAFQVVTAGAAVFLLAHATAGVVARLAVASTTVATIAVARKVI